MEREREAHYMANYPRSIMGYNKILPYLLTRQPASYLLLIVEGMQLISQLIIPMPPANYARVCERMWAIILQSFHSALSARSQSIIDLKNYYLHALTNEWVSKEASENPNCDSHRSLSLYLVELHYDVSASTFAFCTLMNFIYLFPRSSD